MEPDGYWIAKNVCPFCEGGALLFWVTSEGRVFVICDECDSCYLEPAHVGANRPVFPDNAGGVSSESVTRFLLREARAAHKEELEHAGWGEFVASWHPISSWKRKR